MGLANAGSVQCLVAAEADASVLPAPNIPNSRTAASSSRGISPIYHSKDFSITRVSAMGALYFISLICSSSLLILSCIANNKGS